MLLKNATLVCLDPPRVIRADVRIEGQRIVSRRHVLATHDGEEVLDLEGAVVLPGLVNAHTHLYSALARGMPPPAEAPRNFVEILERVWWRLDRALDEESVHLSALVGGLDAALSGTTVLFDHHASPGFIKGSLETLRGALEAIGLRSVLCYETTDRNGEAGRDEGIEENVAFTGAVAARDKELDASPVPNGTGVLTRGMIGAHASFTLSEETCARLAAAMHESGTSLHVHVAEDHADVDDCRERYACSLPERYHRHGLLLPRTLLAHGVHLTPEEIAGAHARGAWIAHNPRSNMNNAVGHAPTAALKRVALGTDGMDGDMFAEARTAYLKMRDAGRDDAAGAALDMLAGGHRLAAAFFGLPFGKLDSGGPADLVVLDYQPPTPLHAGNLAGHLLFGIDRSHVHSVMVAGRWIVRERRATRVDAADVMARARRAAQALWERIEKL